MSVFAIKILALVTMVIDHSAYYLYSSSLIGYGLYFAMRTAGRIAFPLYAFLLVNGFETNVFYTLAVSLAGMSVLAMLVSRPANFGQALACLAAFVICAICILPNSDYGWYGFALMMFLWFSRRSKPLQAAVLLLWCYAEYVVYIHNWAYFAAAALAVIPVLLYNGRRGRPVKLFFYMIYPLHLAVLGVLVLISAAL